MRSLHPGTRWVFRLRTYGFFCFLLFVAILLLVGTGQTFLPVGWTMIAILILGIIVGEVYARLAYRCWRYEFTTGELKIEEGVILKRYKSIPYQRIQNVEISRGPVERILGFSNLAIHTAGYSAPIHTGLFSRNFVRDAEGNIPGVAIEEAEKIRGFLMAKIGKSAGL